MRLGFAYCVSLTLVVRSFETSSSVSQNDRPINPANLPTILGHLTAGFRLITTRVRFLSIIGMSSSSSLKSSPPRTPMRLLNALTLAFLLASLSPSPQQGHRPRFPLPLPRPPWAGTVGISSQARSPIRTYRDTADLLVSTGMRDAGYVYVNIDDTWQGRPRCSGRHAPQQQIPRHEGSCRLRPLQGP